LTHPCIHLGSLLVIVSNPVLDDSSSLTEDQQETVVINCIIYIVGALIGVISASVKESLIRNIAMDRTYMNMFSVFFQVMGGLTFSFLGFQLQLLSSSTYPSDTLTMFASCKLRVYLFYLFCCPLFPSYINVHWYFSYYFHLLDLSNGFECIFASDTQIDITNVGYDVKDIPTFETAYCSHGLLLILGYVVSSLILNLMMIIVVTYSG
jgi:hypothetical protein